jgi:hypothetical protein
MDRHYTKTMNGNLILRKNNYTIADVQQQALIHIAIAMLPPWEQRTLAVFYLLTR